MRSPNFLGRPLFFQSAHPFLLFLFFTLPTLVFSQRPLYKIIATLDTVAHTLECQMQVSYTNTSAEALDRLGIHLWANAYKQKNTALNHQKLHQGDLTLHRAKAEDRGGYNSVSFSSPDQSVILKADDEHIDIGWVILSTPLQPGTSIHLTSDFIIDIPKSFSRIGRTGNSYQITQWYPHIGVLNEEGWHMMPYLDQGEFFNDFADYEVTIQVPSSYKIAATGSAVSNEQTDSIRQYVFKAENVIDFAWFASPTFTHKRFMIDVGGVNRRVALNLFIDEVYSEYWDTAHVWAERAMLFYSDWLGPYPYPEMTVVSTPFSRAGYMEYPMLAQISFTDDPQLLDRVIAHEIGHTWIYGILANDERTHPWMDEGFNSFIEDEYMHTYYANPNEIVMPRVVHNKHSMNHYEALQHMLRITGTTEPPATSPVSQFSSQYIFSAYSIPAQGLRLMMSSVGKEQMKNMFRTYFELHQFTHVTPGDVQASFELSCKCDLSWFFDDWIHHGHQLDYAIKNFKPKQELLTLKNYGAVLPVKISEYDSGQLVKTYVIPGFEGEKELEVNEDTDEVRIFEGSMGANRQWGRNIKPQKSALFGLVPKIGNYERATLAFTPVIGYNLADGGLPGVVITSDLLPQPNFKIVLMPMFGIESKEFRYFGEARYSGDIEGQIFDKFLMGISASSFAYHVDTHYLFRDYYDRFSPFIGLRMDQQLHSHVTKWWKYRYVSITQLYGRGTNFEEFEFVNEKRHYGIHEFLFQISSDTVLQPYTATASLQTGRGFARINLNYKQHFRGRDKMMGVWVHGFAGWLPYYKNPLANVQFSFNGISSNGFFSKDYMFDEWLLGRNAVDGNISRQVFMKDAGLKTLSTIGISDDWMVGGGASVALPFKVVHIYMDAALYDSSIDDDVSFSYSGGLAIILMKDAFEIYIPLLESKDIRESLSYQVRDQWYDRISFQANFKLGNPLALVDKYQFKF